MKFFGVLAFFTCAGIAFAQSDLHPSVSNDAEQHRPLRTLVLSKQTSLEMPSFGYEGIPLCDANGNLYFEAVNPGVPAIDQGPFIRVSRDGKQHVLYLPPSAQHGGPRFNAVLQAVSPDGAYYLLGRNEQESVLIRYRDDGSVLKEHRLMLPSSAYPQMLAVADDGVVYVAGYIEAGPGNNAKKSFAGTYADDGSLIADLSKEFKDFDPASLTHLPEGAVIAGQDGLFYNLQDNRVVVFSQGGKLEKAIPFRKPDAVWSAIRLDVSGGLASIRLVAPEPQPDGLTRVSTRLLLLDVQTGEQRGIYGFSPGAPSSVMCFSRQDGFSVYGVKDGQAVRNWYTLQ